MSSSNVLMYFVPVIVTPILTRLYAQEAFGEWGVFSSVIAILGVGMFWGYENAIVKAHDEADARHTGLLCLLTSGITLLLTALVFTVGSATGLPFFQSFPEKGLLFAYLVVYALYIILYNFCNRQEKYNVLGFNNADEQNEFCNKMICALNKAGVWTPTTNIPLSCSKEGNCMPTVPSSTSSASSLQASSSSSVSTQAATRTKATRF